MSAGAMGETLTILTRREDRPGEALAPVFERYWPAYARWMRRARSIGAARCRGALREHMPELAPVFDELAERFGGGDPVARFLSLYCPPALVRACSQAVVAGELGPTLLRTYDHSPRLFDGVVLRSAWGGEPVLAVTDCVWGALDGVNARGLAVALAFGGRMAEGPGFAAPLVVRYLLQTCSSAGEARRALARLPVHMPYTFVVLDAQGEHLTAFLGPDRGAEFVSTAASTNHQRSADEWPEYARHTESVARLEAIEAGLAGGGSLGAMRRVFLRSPVWRTDYASGSGTLYASAYSPGAGELSLHWPGREVRLSLSEFPTGEFEVELPDDASPSRVA